MRDFDTVCPITLILHHILNILSNGEVEEEFNMELTLKKIWLTLEDNTFTFSNKDKISSFYYSIEVTTDPKINFYFLFLKTKIFILEVHLWVIFLMMQL